MNNEQLQTAFFKYFNIIDQDIITLYLMKFKSLNQNILKKNLDYLISNWVPGYGRKYPSIAEVLQGAQPSKEELESRILYAWEDFLSCLRKGKFNDNSKKFLTGLGVFRCSMATENDLYFLKKDFEELFLTYEHRKKIESINYMIDAEKTPIYLTN